MDCDGQATNPRYGLVPRYGIEMNIVGLSSPARRLDLRRSGIWIVWAATLQRQSLMTSTLGVAAWQPLSGPRPLRSCSNRLHFTTLNVADGEA